MIKSVASPSFARRSTVSGGAALRKLLDAERHDISRAPVLIISSSAGETGTFVEQVDHQTKRVFYHTQMQAGLRTISSEVTSVFPLVQDVQDRVDLAKRIGAETIIASGVNSAMDLAKAILIEYDMPRCFLVPASYSAVLAASSSHSLLLDPNEQELLAQDASHIDSTIVLEPETLAKIGSRNAIHASMAIGLDAILRGIESPDVPATLETALEALDDESRSIEAMALAGNLFSFGQQHDTRSSPLALAASLIPPAFPTTSMVTFMASLLPGILHVAPEPTSELEKMIHEHIKWADIPSLASLVTHSDLALSIPHLMSHVHRSRESWNCLDVDDHVLEHILRFSLDR